MKPTLDDFEDDFGVLKSVKKAIRKYGLERMREAHIEHVSESELDQGFHDLQMSLVDILRTGCVGIDNMTRTQLTHDIASYFEGWAQQDWEVWLCDNVLTEEETTRDFPQHQVDQDE